MSGGGAETLGSKFTETARRRQKLEQLPSSNSPEYQELLSSILSDYQECLDIADLNSIFSPNESLDDISTNDIQYLLIQFFIAELVTKRTGGNRKSDLLQAQSSYSSFLKQLDSYDILSKDDSRLLEHFTDSPTTFSVASSTDPTSRRETKIKRFKAEKDLKQRLSHLQSDPAATQDEEIARRLHLQHIALSVHQTFQALESIAQELHILSLAPPVQAPEPTATSPTNDNRDRARDRESYSDRLDGPLSAGLTGPLLDNKGKPMRPFTLLDKRQQLQAGVFRPDHSLPTMTIDEYLDEERRRGGIIEGGGAASGIRPEVDEDDFDKADQETMKARAWDEFVEENPKGAGNTINRG